MSRLEEIKDEYAISKGFKDFWELYYASNYPQTIDYISDLMKLYAQEVAQASLEKASEKAEIIESSDSDYSDYVDKESIKNPENIVLL